MNGRRFDALVRALGDEESRRDVLRRLAGVVGAGLLGGLATVDARACRAKGKPCRRRKHCCSTICTKRTGKRTGKCACRADGKSCTAAARHKCCSGRCRDDACVDPCPSGLRDCGGDCVDPQTDVDHCGDCDQPCRFGHGTGTCHGGDCVLTECDLGFDDCEADGNCETELGTDAACAACGDACTGGKTCQSGACDCPPGKEECSGTCRNLQNDRQHCGECDKGCAATENCVAGQCACHPDFPHVCDGQCVNTNANSDHCGACNNPCPAGSRCQLGTCCIQSGFACDHVCVPNSECEACCGQGGSQRFCSNVGTCN